MKKKKRIYQILSFMFCCMFLLFVGCSAGGGSDGAVLDGTKVLSRPTGYSFAEAVGEFSEHYYNLYAANILGYLYEGYTGNEKGDDFDSNIINADTTSLSKDDFVALKGDANTTYGKFSGNEKYYLYDSMRYTISRVESFYASNTATNPSSETVYLELDKSWDWSIKDNTDKIFFQTISPSTYSQTGNTAKVTFSGNWLNAYNNNLDSRYPNFKDSYVGAAESKQDTIIPNIVNYYKSPYYETVVEESAASTAKNFFQDALEYAIYMFVLGYDYHTYDNDGQVIVGVENPTDAPYFTFDVKHGNDGYVSGMTVAAVPGVGTNVSVVDALAFAKSRYQEIGGYVGVVEKNLQQITRFILEKVIGSNSPDVVNVSLEKYNTANNNGPITDKPPYTLEFNRNYEAIVNNVVRYACEQAPIGATMGEDGKIDYLSLSNGFSASMITEYKGNYFFGNYDTIVDGVHVNDDSELFKNIEAAEYQSLIIYPGEELIGKTLGDLWLDFEYYENNDPTKTMLDELTINVGFRYYDHKQNKVVVDEQAEMKIVYGKSGTQKDEHGEDISDQSMFMVGEGEDGPYQVFLEEGSVEFREFDNTIGGGVLNPFVSGTNIDESAIKASKYLSGYDNARKYYKLNNSESGGQYGTLNETMFAGDGGCSFIEVYFDIVKDPSKSGVSYDFKVCLRTVTEHQDPNAEPDIDEDFDEDDF